MEQALYELPEGWDWKKFNDVCQLKRGYDLPKQSRIEGKFPLFSANGVTDYIDQFKVRAPGVVTGRSGTIGKVHFVDKDFWPLNTALYVQDFKGNDERFILFFLKAFDLARFVSGAAVPTLNRNSLSSEVVCIPGSIKEQKRIVAKLDALFIRIDTAIVHVQQILELSKSLFASALDEALNPIGDDGELPEGWKWLSVKNLSNKIQYGYTTKAREEGNAQFLRITDIQNGRIEWSSVPFVSVSDDELEKYRLHEEDLVFARSGATSGKSILIIAPPRNSIFASYLIRVVPDTKAVFPRFLELFFQSPGYWKQVGANVSGAAQPNINGTKLSAFQVSLPNLNEQKRIVAQLDVLSESTRALEAHTQEKTHNLSTLKASLLDAAFKGQL